MLYSIYISVLNKLNFRKLLGSNELTVELFNNNVQTKGFK